MKVLFMSPVPLEGAGCRARIIQYLPYLQEAGIEATVRPFMDRAFFYIAYRQGSWGRKTFYMLRSLSRRVGVCLEARHYDVIYIYRECAPIGPPVFEWLLMRWGKPIVYDLDDAIYLPSQQEQLRGHLGRWLKWYQKVPWILRRCQHAVVGNSYLKAYAERFASRVTVLPTPEDLGRFGAREQTGTNGRLTIGWIGTHSTARYLEHIGSALQKVAQRHAVDVKIVGAGRPVTIPGVSVANLPWRLEEEPQLVQSFDVGVYPLSGSEFDCGKACYKAILYMAAGVPVIASNHGANREIIQHEHNGLLASTESEWVERLTRLIEDPLLRHRLREEGRKTVAARYSVAVNAPTLIRVLKSVRQLSRGQGT